MNMKFESWNILNYYSELNNKRQTISTKITEDFELCKWIQGWIYWYKTRIRTNQAGKVYLKAFEVTKDISLSESNTPERSLSKTSEIKVSDTNNLIQQFTLAGRPWYSDDSFVIYEWDRDKKYVARLSYDLNLMIDQKISRF